MSANNKITAILFIFLKLRSRYFQAIPLDLQRHIYSIQKFSIFYAGSNYFRRKFPLFATILLESP